MNSNELHAHVSSDTSDCDGRISRSYVITFNDDERRENSRLINNFADLHFKERVLGGVVSFHPSGFDGDAEVHITRDGFTYSEPTDEGYHHVEVEWCEDDCSEVRETYRDHRAESMGY